MKTLITTFSLLAFCMPLAAPLMAQAPKGQREKADGLPQINAIDKLLAVEASLNSQKKRSTEEQWVSDYQALYTKFMRDGRLSALPGEGKSEIYNALALGIKASDGVIALKARNVEALNLAAEQIEQLALRLGATRRELGMADTVKRYANQGHWLNAFMALGFLEKNVLAYLREDNTPEKKSQAVLVIVGGWMQAGRCVTHVILENYNDDVSNILREPRWVLILEDEMKKLPPAYLNDPLVQKITNVLPEIRKRVTVGMREPVKKEDVLWIHQQFDALITEIAPKGASATVPTAPVAK